MGSSRRCSAFDRAARARSDCDAAHFLEKSPRSPLAAPNRQQRRFPTLRFPPEISAIPAETRLRLPGLGGASQKLAVHSLESDELSTETRFRNPCSWAFYRDFTAIWGREWPELVTETLVWEQLALADGQIPCRWNRELTGNSGGAVGGPRFQASIARA